MPARDHAPVGSPCWVDLMTPDPDSSRRFYGELFGWQAEAGAEEFGGYFNFTKNGVRVAGCMPASSAGGGPNVWSVYLATDDATKTAEAITAHGGQILAPVMAVGQEGTMAVASDPGGATIGLWQPNQHHGFGLLAESDAPAWFELNTRDYRTTVDFYREVFRWDTHEMSDSPEFRYTTLGEGDSAQAGIMDASGFLPEGVPSSWSVYFGADDTDAALAKVVELGGAVITAAEDTPYGRLATATDATGAQFKLVAGGG
jgi:uncharacterized protein